MPRLSPEDFVIRTVGPATRPSPLALSTTPDDDVADYVPDGAGVLFDIEVAIDHAVVRPRVSIIDDSDVSA